MTERCDCEHAEDHPHDEDEDHCSGCGHAESTVGGLSQSKHHPDNFYCDDCIADGLG